MNLVRLRSPCYNSSCACEGVNGQEVQGEWGHSWDGEPNTDPGTAKATDKSLVCLSSRLWSNTYLISDELGGSIEHFWPAAVHLYTLNIWSVTINILFFSFLFFIIPVSLIGVFPFKSWGGTLVFDIDLLADDAVCLSSLLWNFWNNSPPLGNSLMGTF